MKNIKKKKPKTNEGERILKSVVRGLNTGIPTKETEHMRLVVNLAESGQFKPTEEGNELVKMINAAKEEQNKMEENVYDILRKKSEEFEKRKIEEEKERKKMNKFFYKWKYKLRAKFRIFKEKVLEIWSFIKHEFYTMRRLVIFTNDLFFGSSIKNRKLFYNHKKTLIIKEGYYKGEKRYNSMIKNITKGAEINHKMIETHG